MSDAWGHLLVAQGSAEALLECGPCYAWDVAATGIVVREAGGTVTTLAGTPPEAGSDLLVSNGALHQRILAAVGS